MSSQQLVKESEWSEEYKNFVQSLNIPPTSKDREDDVFKNAPDDGSNDYHLAVPEKYCDSCGRRLFNFEVNWDESNPEKDEHCCEVCWLATK